eukprot:g851.t1
MSSKTSEEKVVENSDEDASDEEPEYTLLYKANKFLGKEIDGMTQSFINEYAHEFDVEEDEHKLIFTELHLKYVKMFENMLEDFVVEECPNMSRLQAFRIFFSEAKSSITGQFQPLFAEEEDLNRPFVDQVLAATEYDCFYAMMINSVDGRQKK